MICIKISIFVSRPTHRVHVILKAADIPETLLKPNQQILTKIAVKMLFMFGKRLAKVTSIPIDRALKNILFPLLTLKSEKMHLLLLHIHTFHKCF